MLTVSSPALIAQNALVPASEEEEEEEEVEEEEEEDGAEIIALETAERGTAGEGEVGSEREGD